MLGFLILGNQLFDPKLIPQDAHVFMREDIDLCSHFKYHKLKISFFLSAMRKYAADLRSRGISVHYETFSKVSYEESLIDFLKQKKIKKISSFEIEDKFFETRIANALNKNEVEYEELPSPMFLTTRAQFKSYLRKTKKPFMRNFYEAQRKRLNILVDKELQPTGGQWSFDEDNRKSLPKNYVAPALEKYQADKIDDEVRTLVEKTFKSHPGSSEVWLATTKPEAFNHLKKFLKERFKEFGPYEDALSDHFPFLNHSVLTPYLNTGLLTPREVISEVISFGRKNKIPLNSLEGFVRQIIGWREFIRGIYQNYSEEEDSKNFFKHTRKLNDQWYKAETGIPPLDTVLKKVSTYGYAHHIERLMVVGSLMLLLEVHPHEAHRWFMEMFIDSSDWVMGPNVYGMAIFSDGGIFATKPYICGSNYYRKMGGYKKGDWCDGVDGLYWRFIEKHSDYFMKNPRLSMMARTVAKMDPSKKDRIYSAALALQEKLTTKD